MVLSALKNNKHVWTIPVYGVMGARAVIKMKKNEGSKWYGKISTTVFYIVMIVLIFFQDISEPAANLLILFCGGFMLLAFIMYARHYHTLQKNRAELQREQRTDGKGAEGYAEYGKKIFGKDETS